ncbi:RbsD/FucU family protein [Cohnella zeiphila]|uniref:Fucose isomerase n=1 Tax=Cohnella zeiphila TaxID=2761120 RepID=A0A7X0SMJ4_9BACL|nr:RbsD/FucU domain-containing protein [Cohnella zeiphila]MBB6732748.1 fucose isomerase [Cohnella zeiphila]
MLKGIPMILSPDLMKTLMEMGHGDELVLSDGNFPAATCGKRLVRCDGHSIIKLLEAIMIYFPLDLKVERPAAVMSLLPNEQAPVVWEEYMNIIRRYEASFTDFDYVDRFAFYERAKHAFAVVATSDMAFKGNLILKKGVVRENN